MCIGDRRKLELGVQSEQCERRTKQQELVNRFAALLAEAKVAGYNISVDVVSGQGFTMHFNPKAISVQLTLIDIPLVPIPEGV